MRKLITVLLSVALIWTTQQSTPVKKSLVDKASTNKVTVAAKPPTPKKVPQVQPVKEAVETPRQVAPFASGCSTYDSLFRQYAWDVSVAEAICQAESGGNPYALSQTQDRGLMQINSVHADMVNGDLSELYTPTTNISVAWKIYSAHGWRAWSTYLNGAYTRYL